MLPSLRINEDQSRRHRRELALMLFTGNAMLYSMRVNLSVAIVAMVGQSQMDRSAHSSANPIDLTDTCPVPEDQILSEAERDDELPEGEFDWEEHTQGMILSAFFWGYTMTNFVGGRLSERFGGKVVYGCGLLICAIMTLLSPLAARFSTSAFILVRGLAGMGQGVTFPAINVLMSNWVPQRYKASFLSFTYSGCQLGNVLTLSMSGAVCESRFGWSAVFLICGIIALSYCLIWFTFAEDYPPGTPVNSANRKQYPVPWTEIFTSAPFLCVIVADFAANWGFYCLLTEMPSYLANILHFDVHTNGLVSSIPYFGKWLFMIFYSSWLDKSVSRGLFSIRFARRMSSFIGLVIPGIMLASIQFAGCDRYIVIMLLFFAIGISGADHSGFLCAFQELAPNYAGTLTGLCNSVASLPGIFAPQLTGYLTTGSQTLSAWRKVFLLTSIFNFIGAGFYLTFMSEKVQPWNEPPAKK